MVTSDSSAGVDVSPTIVSEIEVDGRRLVAKEPIRYEVAYEGNAEEPLFTLEGEFDVIEYAFSRDMLIDVLHDTLEVMWRHFVDADPVQVSPRAYQLGVELGRRFEDAASAASGTAVGVRVVEQGLSGS